MLYGMGDVASLVPVAIVAMVAGGTLLWQVALNKRWAVIALFVVAFFWIASNFGIVTHKTGDVGLNWQNGPKFIFYLSFIALGVLNIKRIVPFLADPVMFCGLLYLALALLSVTISEAPLVTVAAVVVVVSYVMFACIAVQSLSIREVMLLATWTLAVYCLISLLAAPLVPSIAFPQAVGFGETESDLVRFQGFAGHPNSMGAISMIYLLFLIGSIWLGYLRRVVWVPMVILGLVTIIATQSRTSVFDLVIACGFQIRRRVLIPMVVLIVMLALGIYLSGEMTTILALIGRDGNVEEAETMSGRAELWQFTWGLILNRPWLGYGAASFESYAQTVWTGDAWAAVVSPHNNYLSLLYDSGIIGGLPLIAMFAILVYRWITDPYLPRDVFTFAILFGGYSEANFPNITIGVTLPVFMVVALDAKRRYPNDAST
jgi:O-antigen ligase